MGPSDVNTVPAFYLFLICVSGHDFFASLDDIFLLFELRCTDLCPHIKVEGSDGGGVISETQVWLCLVAAAA